MPTAPTRTELSCNLVETYIALHAIIQRLQPIALAELERRNKRFLKSEQKNNPPTGVLFTDRNK